MESIPRLVDPGRFIIKDIPKQNVKLSLNKTILILFCIFMIFFLWNCKYGIFRSLEDPLTQSLVYSLK